MPAKFSLAAIETAKQNLDAMPAAAKEIREVGLREAIRTLSPTIRKLMRKGYSRSAMVELLREQGIPVSLSTLKQYFREKALPADEAGAQTPVSTIVTTQPRPEDARGLDRGAPTVAPAVGQRRGAEVSGERR